MLDEIGCSGIPITACKGDPDELEPLVQEGTICRMPCACFADTPGGDVHGQVEPRICPQTSCSAGFLGAGVTR